MPRQLKHIPLEETPSPNPPSHTGCPRADRQLVSDYRAAELDLKVFMQPFRKVRREMILRLKAHTIQQRQKRRFGRVVSPVDWKELA